MRYRRRANWSCPLITRCLTILSLLFSLTLGLTAETNKVTYAADDKRTGWYANQPLLDPATVGGSGFGSLFDTPVIGQVYAQPLVSNGVLLVATEANWICGLDPFSGTVLWSRNLGPAWNVADVGAAI